MLTVAVQEYRDRTSGLCVCVAVVGRDVRQTGGNLGLYGQSGVQITRIAALLREGERESWPAGPGLRSTPPLDHSTTTTHIQTHTKH